VSRATKLRGQYNALQRYRHHDDPDLVQVRRALAIATVEERVRRAVEQAPPLDADTLARIRALIPPIPVEDAGDA
jgi:hypothetical protein